MTRLRTLSILWTLALLLAACGGDGGGGGDATDEEAGETGADTDEGGSGGTDNAEAAAPEPVDLTFVAPAASLAMKEEVAIAAVATELGYYEDEGLTVDVITADGSTAALQAVAGGSGDVTPTAAESVISGVAEGVPVSMIGGLVVNWPWRIAVSPDSDIESIADLDGGSVGVISLASGSAPYARAALEQNDLVADEDVQLVPVGLGPPAATALTEGEVDSLALFTQAYAAIENAGVDLRYLENPELFDPLFSLTWTMPNELLESQPDVAERFLRASYKALLFSNANPEGAVQIGYETYPELAPEDGDVDETLEQDVRSLQAWLDSTALEGDVEEWGDFGEIDDDRWDDLQEFAIFAGSIDEPLPVDDFYDDSFLEAANDFERDEVLADAEEYEE